MYFMPIFLWFDIASGMGSGQFHECSHTIIQICIYKNGHVNCGGAATPFNILNKSHDAGNSSVDRRTKPTLILTLPGRIKVVYRGFTVLNEFYIYFLVKPRDGLNSTA